MSKSLTQHPLFKRLFLYSYGTNKLGWQKSRYVELSLRVKGSLDSLPSNHDIGTTIPYLHLLCLVWLYGGGMG